MTYKTIIHQKASGMAAIPMNRLQAMNAIMPDKLKELNTAVLEAEQIGCARNMACRAAGLWARRC